MSPMFASLRIFNYRLWIAGALVSNTGTWMQRVAQDWLVLTDLTDNSAVAVGVTTGLQFGPALLFGPLGGLLADRVRQRRLLMITQALMGVWGLLLGLLVLTGTVHLWHVYALAAAAGITSAIDGPARQTFVAAMVPPSRLGNAVSLNGAAGNAARLLGPALAGVLIAAFSSTGPVFVINAATFAATMVALVLMRGREMHRLPRARKGKGQIRDALGYVWARPDLLMLLFVVGMVSTFGLNFQMTTALMARIEFGKGATEYGILGSMMAVGSLAGALLAARRPQPRLRLVVASAAAFGVCALVAAAMPTYETFALALVPVGLTSLTVLVGANAAVQMSTAPQMRGRVMALYMAVVMGGTPVGAPLVGWVGQTYGPRWTIAMGGLVAVAVAVAAVTHVARRRTVVVSYRPEQRPRFVLELHTPTHSVPSEGPRSDTAALEPAAA